MKLYFDLDRALQMRTNIDAEVAEYNAGVAACNHRVKKRLVALVGLFEVVIVVFTWFCFFRHALAPEAWEGLRGAYAVCIGGAWIFFGFSVASFAFWTCKERLNGKYRSPTKEYPPAVWYLYKYQRGAALEPSFTEEKSGKITLMITAKDPTSQVCNTVYQHGFTKKVGAKLKEPIFDLDKCIAYFPSSVKLT